MNIKEFLKKSRLTKQYIVAKSSISFCTSLFKGFKDKVNPRMKTILKLQGVCKAYGIAVTVEEIEEMYKKL